MPQSTKSPTLRVATLAPRDRAMAAIRASGSPIGRPARRRFAAMSANSLAAALSKGNIRSTNRSPNSRSNTVSSARRRLPSGSNAAPNSSSASVMLVVNNVAIGSDCIQRSTFSDGRGRNPSDKTLVSRTITKNQVDRAAVRAETAVSRTPHKARRAAASHQPGCPEPTALQKARNAVCRAPPPPSIDCAVPHAAGVGA